MTALAMGEKDAHEAGAIRSRLVATRSLLRGEPREHYWTVTVPVIPFMMCGVQTYSYVPAGMLANEIV